jgi:hypothetical protein
VAAARQAEVGAADPQPTVGGRVGEHRLDELAIGLLDGIALGERAVRLGHTARELVADHLQLAQVEHPRRTGGPDPVRHAHATETLGDQPTELTLELADLPAQLGAGQTLVYANSLEYSPHGHILSRLQGRCSNP